MGTVRLNIEDDLILKKSKISSGFKHNERESNSVLYSTDHIHFVICNLCYWCASYFNVNDLESSSQVLDCPICNSHNTELMPITTDESFRIEYSLTIGMEMEFYKANKVVVRQHSANEHQMPI